MSLRINKICRTVLLLVLIACVFGFFATTFNRSVQAEDVAAENFYTEDGASVRYNADTPGIRFTSYITENYYNELKQKAADGVLNFYTLIEKADGSSSSKVEIEHKQSVEFNESGTAVFNAALVFKKASGDLTATEIKEASAIELKASAYVRYTDNMGQTVTESAANGGVVRSMRGIANYAIRVGVSEEQSNFLSMYLGNTTIENVLQKVVLTDKAAVELFGLTEGAVYIGAKKVGDIAGGKIDLSLVTLPTDSTTEVYVFDKDNNCTIYTCLFVQPLTLTENYVVGLNRPSATYAYTLQGEEPIVSVKVGGTEIASSDYLQSGNSVTLNASAFTAAGDTSVVIETSAAVYAGRAEVYDIAIGSLEEFKAFWSREGIPADSTVTSKIVLTADIDASSYSFHGGNVLMGFTFDGILDGKGHTIKGAPSSYFGLMRTLGINGVIKNVAFTGIRFFRTSAIINDQLNGRIENCYFEGSGGNGAEDNALCKYIQNNTAVLKNVVVYLHDRPSGTETQCGMFRSSLSLTTAPKGIYFINTSSNGKICDGAGATDLSDVHLYSSLAEFTTEVTELPAGFTREFWHMGENGLTFGKVLDAIQLTENYVVGLNRPSATYAYTLQGEEPIISVKVGGTEIASSDYLQNGNSVTLNASAFTAAGDTSVVIETSAAVYAGRAEVYDIAIGSLEEFKGFWSKEGQPATTVTTKVAFTADIDASSYNFNGGTVIANSTFNGIIDGKGHTVKGAPSGYYGMFYCVGSDAVIKNIAFTGIRFFRVSAIVNYKLEGRIENCYFEGSGGSAADNNALSKQMGATAVLKNVVVYLHDRPSGTETQCGVFVSLTSGATSLTTAPEGVYVVNDSSNGKICDGAGATDLSDVHLYSSLGEFINDVTELPEGFSPDIWRIDENGGLVFTSSPEGLPTFGLHNVKIKENSSRTFVRNKKSEYVIIADNDGAEMAKAVKFITDNVYKATGVTLSKETYVVGRENGWTKNDKLIVFDNERFFAKAGLNMPVEKLKNGGYYIKTAGNTVFIMCEGEDGYQLGAIRFLSETLGYDRLSVDCIVYDKSGATIPDMEITEEPDFEYRMPSTFKMPNAVYGMGFNKVNFNSMFMSVPNRATGTDAVTMHNSYNYLPPSMYKSSHPKWYSNAGNSVKQQLCYTAHGDSEEYTAMVDTLYEYLKQIVDANPFMSNITVTQQDNLYYCDCAECASVIAEYGAVSAAYIMFLNDIDDKLQADLEAEAIANGTKKREVNIVFFAYHGTKKSPTKLVDGKYQATSEKVIMNEHVGVLVAPIESYYTSSFYSDKNKAFGETESIKSWSCLTNKVYMWIYETYFNNYFYPYNSWETILPNYMFCYENNAVYMFDQGQHNQASPSAFMAFKYYLDSKAGINVNRSYKELEEKFFSGYFKEAADSMKNYYNALKVQLKYLEENYPSVDGGINNGKKNVLANASYWSVDILNEYLGYIQTALSDVAFYESTDYATYCMLKNHILAESLFPRYALLTLYADSFSDKELTEKRASFKEDCEALGVTQEAEATSESLSVLFANWGL